MTDEADLGNIELPIVTIFGAGIAGLTTAQELADRGFRVQVVEPKPHDFCEYQCAVGGLAANQFTRVRAPLSVLHPTLTQDGAQAALNNLRHALKFRDWRSLERTAPRYPLLEKICFDKTVHGGAAAPHTFDVAVRTPLERHAFERAGARVPEDWRQYWDRHGNVNAQKLVAVFATLRRASRDYMSLYFPKLAQAMELGADNLTQFRSFTEVHQAESADDPRAKAAAEEEVAKTFIARETLLVRIVGYTDADGLPENNRKIAFDWATRVKDALVAINNDPELPPTQKIWELERHLEVVTRGSSGASCDLADNAQRSDANRVEFEIVEQVIPGEHGFRFFPGFYRHLFDTMRRTPIVDSRGAGIGTAMDQLVATPQPQLALSNGLHTLDYWHIGSIQQFHDLADFVRNQLGLTARDQLGLQFAMLKFLTSGPARRTRDAEPINMIQYLGGDYPQRRFSQACLDFLERAPRALAAMSATESDARTQYDITVQLMDPRAPDPRTLNGPTTPTWLDPWKAHLKTQGVRFFVGRLAGARVVNGQLTPIVRGPERDRQCFVSPMPENPDQLFREPDASGVDIDQHRFVLATQYQVASSFVWDAYATARQIGATFEGPFRQLMSFDQQSGRRQLGDQGASAPTRDPATGKEQLTYPTRTISGIQYFFPQQYRIGQSNIYFVSQPWGLTSISQYAYWREHSRPVGQLLGQISVDIGDWHAFFPPPDPAKGGAHGHPAWHLSAQEVAGGCWTQIMASMPADYAAVLQKPRYFHIDQNLVFVEIVEDDDAGEGAGQLTTAASRANAIIRLPYLDVASAPVSLQAGRMCRIRLNVGPGEMETKAKTTTLIGDTNASLRDRLLAQLCKDASDLVLAEPCGAKAPNGTAASLQEFADIALSPIVKLDAKLLPKVMVAVLGGSQVRFVMRVGALQLVVEGAGKSAAEICDAFVALLAAKAKDIVRVERAEATSLMLTPADASNEPVAVGVLNTEGKIELVGAPVLNLQLMNLQLLEPAQGYALLRNNYQYQINIPDQWRARPGLWRGKDANIPAQFRDLSAVFGARDAEIYYGHPRSCPLLRYWFGAGTYMATYTRMTTMEAANESGRHAAAAILYGILEDALAREDPRQMRLAGDFPQIWPLENNEPQDLQPFVAVDDALFEAGLPHLFDILSVTSLINSLAECVNPAEEILKQLQSQIERHSVVKSISADLIGKLGRALVDFLRPGDRARQ